MIIDNFGYLKKGEYMKKEGGLPFSYVILVCREASRLPYRSSDN